MTSEYKSDDKSLSFCQRIALASKESEQKQDNYKKLKLQEAENIMDTVEKFVKELCNPDDLISKMIKAVENERPDANIKVIEVWTYDVSDQEKLINGSITSANDPEKSYSTRYILSSGYMRLTDKYIKERSKSVKELMEAQLATEDFNFGVDPTTKQKYKVCIFTRKGKNSRFKNGIYISRDGVEYADIINKPNSPNGPKPKFASKPKPKFAS